MQFPIVCFHSPERARFARLLHAVILALVALTLAAPLSAQECLYVLNRLDGSIGIINRASTEEVGRIPLTECPLPQCQPTALVIDAARQRAYVPRLDTGTVYVVDLMGQAIVTTVTAGAGGAAGVLSPGGNAVYIANLAGDSVSVIDTTSLSMTDTIDVGDGPRALAFTPDGTELFVANGRDDTVSVIRAADGEVIDTITVGDEPGGIAITGNEGRAYVSNARAGTVSVIDLPTGEVVNTITIGAGSGPRDIALGPNNVAFVSNTTAMPATLAVIDLTNDSLQPSIEVGTGPVAISLSDDGATAYVAALAADMISVVDTATRETTSLPGGGSPFDVALAQCPPTAVPTPTATPVPAACVGDCNDNGRVAVNELIQGVNIAIGNAAVASCPSFDVNGNGEVSINELIRAVSNALNTCSA